MLTISRSCRSSSLLLAALLSMACKDPASSAPSQEGSVAKPASPVEAEAARLGATEVKDEGAAQPAPAAVKVALHEPLKTYIEELLPSIAQVPEERRKALDKLALFVRTKRASGEEAQITFICTHNSRRSHLSQLWAATAAAYYRVGGVSTYSGGTEATAFNPRAVAAVERAGFQVERPEGDNPRYVVTFGPNAPKMTAFSKKYNDPENPQSDFAAVMTCTDADKNCPTVEGATLRVGLPYVDPKVSDGTEREAASYDERSRQIATEMFYVFSRVVAAG